MPTVLKLLFSMYRPMLFAAPAARVVAPVTVNAPLWVIAPAVATASVPLTVDADRIKASASFRLTFLPLVMPTVLKLLLDVARLISFAAPAARVVAPVTFNVQLCVIAPAVATASVPLTVDAPRIKASASFRLTFLPLVMLTVPKLLVDVPRLMSFAVPAARVVVPVTASAPTWVIVPPATAVRWPLTVLSALTWPSTRALELVRLTLLSEKTRTAPVKLFAAFVNVMSFAPPEVTRFDVPVTLNAPLWVIAPAVVTVRVPLTVDVPRIKASASFRSTFLPLVIPTVLK